MSTGALISHGVSGYPCLGVPGDWQEQRRGEPFENIINDPITSYMNAQSHIGFPLSNFNEPWTGGELQGINWSAQPYRQPVFGEPVTAPPTPDMGAIQISEINYPSHIGMTYAQQLPSSRIHNDVRLPLTERQNNGWEGALFNMYKEGDNKMFMPHTNVNSTPYSKFFQGASTDNGVHPGSDTANQQTTGNTTKVDFTGGQAPFQKLPNGISIGSLQPQEPPPLFELAPPPDPPVLPGEGTAHLEPTNPSWW